MFQTVYTIKRVNADSIRAYDYQYTQDGLDVYRLDPQGIPVIQPEAVTWEQFKGIARDDIRTRERFPVTLGTYDTQARAREVIQDAAPAPLTLFQAVRFDIEYHDSPLDSWEAADSILREFALDAPQDGETYDKINFKITWEGGQTYEGRFDLKYNDRNYKTLLARQCRKWITYHGHNVFLSTHHIPEYTEGETLPPTKPAKTRKQGAPVIQDAAPAPTEAPAPKSKKGGLADTIANLEFQF